MASTQNLMIALRMVSHTNACEYICISVLVIFFQYQEKKEGKLIPYRMYLAKEKYLGFGRH